MRVASWAPLRHEPWDHDGSLTRCHSVVIGDVAGRDGRVHVEVDTVGITGGDDLTREQFMYAPRVLIEASDDHCAGGSTDLGEDAARELGHLLIDAARRLRLIEQAGYQVRP